MLNQKKIVKFNDFTIEVKSRKKELGKAMDRVLLSGQFILGNEVKSFENEFAEYLGIKHCIGVGNGLEALQIALMTLNIGKGDEVITTPISAVATTLAIMAVGATPVFVDVKENGQINENLIISSITNKTKVIIPVHLYGQPCAIDKIKKICKEYKLFLIEDACQAHGSLLKSKKLGTYGDFGCFSFYPTKNLGCFGDGGAIVTNSDKYARVCREIRDYGQSEKYIHSRYGLNSRLDELQAVILRTKLKLLDKDNAIRRKIASEYINLLQNDQRVKIVTKNNLGNFHLFVIRVKERDRLREYLKKKKIDSLVHFPLAIPDQPLFGKKHKNLKIPIARDFVKHILSLPCHIKMTNNDVKYVVVSIKDFLLKNAE